MTDLLFFGCFCASVCGLVVLWVLLCLRHEVTDLQRRVAELEKR